MSHFSVLVAATDVAAALQPFHEFECTGTNDEYVKERDVTADKREGYAEDTEAVAIDPQGVAHYIFNDAGDWDPRFCVADPERYSSAKKKHIPDGWTEGRRPASERRTFAAWLEHDGTALLDLRKGGDDSHKYGYFTLGADGEVNKIVRRTNPNAKWDWWTEDGRFQKKLLTRDGARRNSARAGGIDWDGMIAAKAVEAARTFDDVIRVIAGRVVVTWDSAMARHKRGEITIDEARALYNDQQVVKDLIEAKAIDSWGGAETLSKVMDSERDAYIKRYSETNATTWALLVDGKWTERGSMGWFGVSDADKQSTTEATELFWRTVRALPADMLCTVVDCHI